MTLLLFFSPLARAVHNRHYKKKKNNKTTTTTTTTKTNKDGKIPSHVTTRYWVTIFVIRYYSPSPICHFLPLFATILTVHYSLLGTVLYPQEQ